MPDLNQTYIQPPINIPIANKDGTLTEGWRTFFTNQNLYLQKISQFGIQTPPIADADKPQLTPLDGTQIWNPDTKKNQLWTGTKWETISSS